MALPLAGGSVQQSEPHHDEHPEIGMYLVPVEAYLMTRLYGAEGMNNHNEPKRTLEESDEKREDFDDSANDLWALYGKEAKSHDQARINTLKEDMDGVLLFVCACLSGGQPGLSPVDVTLIPGWLIFWCSHRVRRATNSKYASKPRGPVGLLPESNRSDTWSNIPTTRFRG
jgi:hypothetical protein